LLMCRVADPKYLILDPFCYLRGITLFSCEMILVVYSVNECPVKRKLKYCATNLSFVFMIGYVCLNVVVGPCVASPLLHHVNHIFHL
jgi:hypothetical protein